MSAKHPAPWRYERGKVYDAKGDVVIPDLGDSVGPLVAAAPNMRALLGQIAERIAENDLNQGEAFRQIRALLAGVDGAGEATTAPAAPGGTQQITRGEAVRAVEGDDRARNYELEGRLRKLRGGDWVVAEWCPFNGVFCRWADHASRETIEQKIAAIEAAREEIKRDGVNPDYLIAHLRGRLAARIEGSGV